MATNQLEVMPTVGFDHIHTIRYVEGPTLTFWAGEPVTEDGATIAPIGDKCVCLALDESRMLFGREMALDVVRGMARSVWHISSWRERARMIYEIVAVLVK